MIYRNGFQSTKHQSKRTTDTENNMENISDYSKLDVYNHGRLIIFTHLVAYYCLENRTDNQ